MATNNLSDISAKMRKLDICMMTTQTAKGLLINRPMSNNGDVEYDGNSYFFTYEESEAAKNIHQNAQVNLGFSGSKDLYISVTGKARLVKEKAALKKHWQNSLEQWFKKGIETPGIVMIHVKASRIKFWQNEEEGEVKF